MMYSVKLSEVIAPAFFDLHRDIKDNGHTHYFIKGGRGSTKSSFVSIEIITGIMKSPNASAIAFRKVGKDVKDSVFTQLLWAIDILGVGHFWQVKLSPIRLIYTPTGQQVLFRGVDDANKSKSIKLRTGYFKYIWFEEADQFGGMEELRKITQSLIRGGSNQKVFYTYNPPKSVQNWLNTECNIQRPDRLIHHSIYKDVPKEWLGEEFFIEAEMLKQTNEDAYCHEYLGEVTGTGGEVFKNVVLREISQEEINGLGNIYRGLDFGFSIDPCAYICCCLHNRKLYIFNEIYKVGMGYNELFDEISKENVHNGLIYADSAEPRSIHELCIRGLKVSGARKYQGSVDHGITRLTEDLTEIIIDNVKCPNCAREFTQYELEKDKDDNFKALFPDKNNHTIDAVRYALSNTELFTRKRGTPAKRKPDFDFQKEKRSIAASYDVNDFFGR